ncbi:hypothetical protein M8J75_015059 [Diaphorina citri]|nr:hypothetical protein M8J75_015059 [Diaphorina citri]KAI5720712.1 hypothetical protein M8J77_010695 [Diaphorina citri]
MMTDNYRRYHYVLAPESSDESSGTDRTESVYSMQDKETEYVRDESDTCTKSDASEYTLYSIPSEKNPLLETDSSDDFIIKTEKIIVETFSQPVTSSNSGEHELESTMGSSDSELGQADYWNCAQCFKTNNNPKFHFCMKCFKLRKEMFPPKPKATKKRASAASTSANSSERRKPLAKKRKRARSSSDHSEEEAQKTIGSSVSKSMKLDSTMKLDTFIGKFDNLKADSQTFFRGLCDEVEKIQESKRLKQDAPSESNVQNPSLDACGNTNSMTTKSLIGRFDAMNTSSQFFSNLCQSVDKVYDAAIMQDNLAGGSSSNQIAEGLGAASGGLGADEVDRRDNVTNSEVDMSALCIMCDKAPKNGAFVHMYEVHVCCCYPCARKVWKQTKKCPTCTLPASKVLKMIIS